MIVVAGVCGDAADTAHNTRAGHQVEDTVCCCRGQAIDSHNIATLLSCVTLEQ